MIWWDHYKQVDYNKLCDWVKLSFHNVITKQQSYQLVTSGVGAAKAFGDCLNFFQMSVISIHNVGLRTKHSWNIQKTLPWSITWKTKETIRRWIYCAGFHTDFMTLQHNEPTAVCHRMWDLRFLIEFRCIEVSRSIE